MPTRPEHDLLLVFLGPLSGQADFTNREVGAILVRFRKPGAKRPRGTSGDT